MKSLFPSVYFFLFISLIVISCERNDNEDPPLYDCMSRISTYNSDDELQWWASSYYADDLLVLYENSTGEWTLNSYDANGNLLVKEGNNYKRQYQYDDHGRVVQETYYEDGELAYKEITDFQGGEDMYIVYRLNSKEDTMSVSKTYFHGDEIPDSVISDYYSTYYYYSPEVDSSYSYSDGSLMTKRYERYENGNQIYLHIIRYDPEGDFYNETVRHWEYNAAGELGQYTNQSSYFDGREDWFRETYHYTEEGDIRLQEHYSAPDQLSSYIEYSYAEGKLIKTTNFSSTGNILSYALVEDSCEESLAP